MGVRREYNFVLLGIFSIVILGALGFSQDAYASHCVPPIIIDINHNCIFDLNELGDSDGDGLIDFAEGFLKTDPANPDTDGDGLTDGFEMGTTDGIIVNFVSNPLIFDTDGDGFSDGDEVKKYGTNPLDIADFPPDTDLDSLVDFDELQIGADPTKRDTDNDGLQDGEEVNTFETDPLNPDTDEDGIADGDEVALDFDPLNPLDPFPPVLPKTIFDWSMPERFGLDGNSDGLIDYFETFESVNPPFWQVDFDACDLLQADPPISTYQWTVLDKVIVKSTCDGLSLGFPNEGSFMVTLNATNTEGESASVTQEVIVQDWLVVSFGDSYASGEGVPDISVDGELVSIKIQNLKLVKDELEQTLFTAIKQKDELVSQVGILNGQLNAALEEGSGINLVTLALCLSLKGDIDFSNSEITRLTNNINNENNKDWWERDYISLGFWETERALIELTLPLAQKSFDDNDCNGIFQKLATFSGEVQALRDQILVLKNQIAALATTLTSLPPKISQLAQDISALVDLYNQSSPQWQSVDDHRSANSGHAKASLWLEKSDPRTSVTFVHMAKSGNIIPNIPDQIDEANDIIGDREIDAVILSIGGNDVLFTPMIVKCMVHEKCNERGFVDEDFAEICDDFILLGFDDECVAKLQSFLDSAKADAIAALKQIKPLESLPDNELLKIWDTIDSQTLFFLVIYGPLFNPLPELDDDGIPIPCTSGDTSFPFLFPLCNNLLLAYKGLAEDPKFFPNLQGLTTGDTSDPRLDRVYHVEYVDATKDENGRYCDPDDPNNGPLSPPFLSVGEHEWFDKILQTRLNEAIADAAEMNGWNLVDGISEGFERHGFCSKDSWMVGLEESLIVQKDPAGTAHPNKKGHAFIGLRVFEELHQDLYQNGDPNFPRAPDVIDSISPILILPDDLPPDDLPPDVVTDNNSGGGGDEHLTRPTFGLSHETFKTIVDGGFRFNDQSFTINDNYHTSFAQQTVNIGEVNSFEAKIYADKRIKVQEFLFGIPNVGEAHLAELGIEIWYDYNGEIEEVRAIQKSNVIDKETIVVTHEKTKCQALDREEKCDTTNVSMVFLETLKDKVLAVKAIDYKGRYQITYLNEGVEIAGESLNPMLEQMIPSNIRDQGLIEVTQLAKYSPYWQSEDGRIFEMNSFGSFKEINQTFERFQDSGTAYTRLHSGFGGVMAYELKRATSVFDASELISDLPDFIPYSPPIISERMTEEMKAKMLEQEKIAKKILEESKVQARW